MTTCTKYPSSCPLVIAIHVFFLIKQEDVYVRSMVQSYLICICPRFVFTLCAKRLIHFYCNKAGAKDLPGDLEAYAMNARLRVCVSFETVCGPYTKWTILFSSFVQIQICVSTSSSFCMDDGAAWYTVRDFILSGYCENMPHWTTSNWSIAFTVPVFLKSVFVNLG